MDTGEPPKITALLKAWAQGDDAALAQLTAVVYRELHHMARRYLRNEHPGRTLQTTALVNEAFLRLLDTKDVDWQHRAQFFAIAARIMRNILVDAARERGARKRGGDVARIDLGVQPFVSPEPDSQILALDDALNAFAALAPRQAKVVELRYFGGMSEEETAEVLRTSPRTVRRDWQFARAWLQRELERG